MKIQQVTSMHELEGLRDDWNRLAGPTPLRQWEWAYSWAESLLGSGKLMVLVGRDDNYRVIGIAPWYLESSWIQGDVIRFIGDGNCCTDYSTILTEPKSRDQFLGSLASWLSRHTIGNEITDIDAISAVYDDPDSWLGWDAMQLEGIDHEDPVMLTFGKLMGSRGCDSRSQVSSRTWTLDLSDGWDGFMKTISKSHRKHVRRVERRLIEQPDFVVHTADSLASFDKGMEVFEYLHQRRWTSAGEEGCFGNVEFADFLRTMARRFFDADSLRLFWLEKAGTPLAADFSFISESRVYAYQGGVNPDMLEHEPGRAANIIAIRKAIEAGQTHLDFLRGDEPYKAHWRAKSHDLVDMEIIADGSLPQLRAGIMQFGRNMKRFAKGNRLDQAADPTQSERRQPSQ